MKIVDNYDLILKYIMVIYEGLHEQIDNVYSTIFIQRFTTF